MFSIDNHSKGYYPHYFNIAENLDYVGVLPDIEYFDADNMKNAEREKFLKWYNTEKSLNKVFNNKDTLVQYCNTAIPRQV